MGVGSAGPQLRASVRPRSGGQGPSVDKSEQRNMDLLTLIFGSVNTVPKEAQGVGLVTVSQSSWDWLALVQNSALPLFSHVTCASRPPVVQQMVSVRPRGRREVWVGERT